AAEPGPRPARQTASALPGLHGRPWSRREGLPGRGDRPVEVGLAGFGDLGDRLPSRRVHGRKPAPRGGGGVGAVDEEIRLQGAHFPVNFGTRFSWFAAIPSLASSLWKRSCWT